MFLYRRAADAPPQTASNILLRQLYDRIIPKDHLLRKIDKAVDFSFVADVVKDKYTSDFGRPAEDP